MLFVVFLKDLPNLFQKYEFKFNILIFLITAPLGATIRGNTVSMYTETCSLRPPTSVLEFFRKRQISAQQRDVMVTR